MSQAAQSSSSSPVAADRYQIIFRQLAAPIPDGWVAGVRWTVEAYPAGVCDLPYPCGTAWVSDYPAPEGREKLTSLDFILVADQFRREGVGKALYEAILARWPGVFVTDAISKSGDAFLDGVQPWRKRAKEGRLKDLDSRIKKARKKKRKAARKRQR